MEYITTPRPCFIQFKFETDNSDVSISVSGNIEELGMWDVQKAVKLKRLYGNIWKSPENIKTFQNILVEYKFIFNYTGNNALYVNTEWEKSSNRQIFTGNNLRLIIFDSHKRKGFIENLTEDFITKYYANENRKRIENEANKEKVENNIIKNFNLARNNSKELSKNKNCENKLINHFNDEDIIYEENFTEKGMSKCKSTNSFFSSSIHKSEESDVESNHSNDSRGSFEFDIVECEKEDIFKDENENQIINEIRNNNENKLYNKEFKSKNVKESSITKSKDFDYLINNAFSFTNLNSNYSELNSFHNENIDTNNRGRNKKSVYSEDDYFKDKDNLKDKDKNNSGNQENDEMKIKHMNSNNIIDYNDSNFIGPINSKDIENHSKLIFNNNEEEEYLIFVTGLLPCSIINNKLIINDDAFYNIIYYSLIKNNRNFIWLGILNPENCIDSDEDVIDNLLSVNNFSRVKLEENVIKNYINYINNYLKPIFRINKLNLNNEFIKNLDNLWENYVITNDEISKGITEIIKFELSSPKLYKKEFSMIKIYLNDIHLLLVPSKIDFFRKSFMFDYPKISLTQGLYLHEPFPSSEVFKKIHHSKIIMKNMFCLYLLGFHLFSTCRNFIYYCKRILKAKVFAMESGHLIIFLNDRKLVVNVMNIYHNQDIISDILTDKIKLIGEQNKYILKYSSSTNDKDINLFNESNNLIQHINYKKDFIFITQEKNCKTTTVLFQIEAFKNLFTLLKKSNKVCNIKMIIILKNKINSNTNSHQSEICKKIFESVNIINKIFEKQIIYIVEDKLTIFERYSLLSIADCHINLKPRSMYNILSSEFILIKQATNCNYFKNIISELSGEKSILTSAIKANPINVKSILEAMTNAVTDFINSTNERICLNKANSKEYEYKNEKMEKEKAEINSDFNHLNSYDTIKWLNSYLQILGYFKGITQRVYLNSIDEGDLNVFEQLDILKTGIIKREVTDHLFHIKSPFNLNENDKKRTISFKFQITKNICYSPNANNGKKYFMKNSLYDEILKIYFSNKKHRLIIIEEALLCKKNYDDINLTAEIINKSSEQFKIIEKLNILSQDAENRIVIISSKCKQGLKYIVRNINRVTLASEYGDYYKLPKENVWNNTYNHNFK